MRTKGRGLVCERYLTLSGVSAFSTCSMWHLMRSAGCRAVRLKPQSAKLTACYRIGAVICSLPWASLHSGARFDLLSGSAARLRRLELGAVSQQGMHDDGEPTGKRDPRLAHRGSFGDREFSVLELSGPM